MRDLSFRRLSPCSISAGVHYPTLSFPLFSINCMASSNDRPPAMEKKEEKAKEKEDGKEAKKVPPPPEMPEPGDCCGSGCVRCVWDVYYDELEAYNKLDKSHPN